MPTPAATVLLVALLRIAAAGSASPPALDVSKARRIEGAAAELAGLQVQVGPALVVPVVQDGRTIGIAFVGDGALSLALPDAADARRFANRQVLYGGKTPAAMRAIAAGDAPYATTASRGFVFGSTAALRPWLEGAVAPTADGALLTEAEAAARALNARLAVLDGEVTLDLGADRGAGADRWLFADFLVDERLRFVRPVGLDSEEDRWLSAALDMLGTPPVTNVLAIGREPGGEVVRRTVGLGPWEEPPDEPEGPRVRQGCELVQVSATLRAGATEAQQRLPVEVDATYVLRGQRSLASVDVDLPDEAAKAGAWRTATLSIDGRPVSTPAGSGRRRTLSIPHSSAAADTFSLRVVYRDSWSTLGGTSMDPTPATELQRPLPRINGGLPLDVLLTAGAPLAGGLTPVLSGGTVRDWSDDATRWVEARSDGGTGVPRVAFGRWQTTSEPAVGDLPAIRVNLFPSEQAAAAGLPAFLRTVVAYFEQVLPPLPTGELELVQQRDDEWRFKWTASMGLITVQQMQVGGGERAHRAERPHLEQEVMAHEVAHQWWGGLVDPARREDRWIAETMAQVYACLFIGAAFGPQECDRIQESWRVTWEEGAGVPGGASLRDAWGTADWQPIAYEYGPYLMLHGLRGRIGDQAFLAGLDAYAVDRSGRPASTERLQEAFEGASGLDLTAFFDFWVSGGLIPTISMTVDGTQVTVTSDVPFGTIEVPVYALINGERHEFWVPVVDGEGRITLPGRASTIKLDPNGLVMARGRSVKRR